MIVRAIPSLAGQIVEQRPAGSLVNVEAIVQAEPALGSSVWLRVTTSRYANVYVHSALVELIAPTVVAPAPMAATVSSGAIPGLVPFTPGAGTAGIPGLVPAPAVIPLTPFVPAPPAPTPVPVPTPGRSYSPMGEWRPGPGAVGSAAPYAGFIDVPREGTSIPEDEAFDVAGWFVDRADTTWAGADEVILYAGVVEAGGSLIAEGTVYHERRDIAFALNSSDWGDAGFSVTVPAGTFEPGTHTLTVYLHTPGRGWWYQQRQVTITAAD